MLLHSNQGAANDCQYRAVFALTHDPEWLDLATQGDPSSDSLLMLRLAQRDILCYPQHVTQAAYVGPCDRNFWTWFRGHAHGIQPGEVGLLVTVWGNSIYHAVAVLLDTTSGTVTVSDSALPGLEQFDWPGFLDSPYARAYRVEMLMGMTEPEQ
ncbi:hypothetical protein ACI3L1_06670 [Deinococcus sp. SM5_A1]|uniref:hypothetical protein n=1 Tax=Deinococcus sp. SM5_A1 TaxID=3379094 RepID=UPI00385B83AE